MLISISLFTLRVIRRNDAPPKPDPSAAAPFSDPKWNSASYAPNVDVTDLFIGGKGTKPKGKKESDYLWIGALFSGDGVASPALRQLRVEFDYPTYDQYLPAIYRDQADCGQFLLRLLSLFESFNQEVEDEIAAIPALFDPKAAPKNFLVWLAELLGLELGDRTGMSRNSGESSRKFSACLAAAARPQACERASAYLPAWMLSLKSRFFTPRGGRCRERRRAVVKAARRTRIPAGKTGRARAIRSWDGPPCWRLLNLRARW